MTRTWHTFAATLFLGIVSSALLGEKITLIHTGSGSGTLGDQIFRDREFVITAIGDTNNREAFSSYTGFSIDHESTAIGIEGLGSFSFVTETRTFNNASSSLVVFSRASIEGLDLNNGPKDAVFADWDMRSSIGPIWGDIQILGQWSGVATSGGELFFESDVARGSFQAVVVPVPEPSFNSTCFALFGLGFLCIRKTGACRRQQLPHEPSPHATV